MSAVPTRPCRKCQRRLVGRFRTDGDGNLVEEWAPCVCETTGKPIELTYDERAAIARKTGLCMDCDEPVEGKRGWALRCATHKRRARLDRENEKKRTDPERIRRRRQSDRKRRGSAEAREKRNARTRELRAERMKDPVYAEAYKRRRQRERSINHPRYHKLHALDLKWNADPDRQEKKRQQARARYYELNPVRPDPHCATCSGSIDWTPGKGRPPKYHQTAECNPYHSPARDEAA